MEIDLSKAVKLMEYYEFNNIEMDEEIKQSLFETFIKKDMFNLILEMLNFVKPQSYNDIIDYFIETERENDILFYKLENGQIDTKQYKEYIFNKLFEKKRYSSIVNYSFFYNTDIYFNQFIQRFINNEKEFLRPVQMLINRKVIKDKSVLKQILKTAKENNFYGLIKTILNYIFYDDHELSYQIIDYLKEKKQYQQLSDIIITYEIYDPQDVESIVNFLMEERQFKYLFKIFHSYNDYEYIEKNCQKIINMDNIETEQKFIIENLYSLLNNRKIRKVQLRNKIINFFIKQKISKD